MEAYGVWVSRDATGFFEWGITFGFLFDDFSFDLL